MGFLRCHIFRWAAGSSSGSAGSTNGWSRTGADANVGKSGLVAVDAGKRVVEMRRKRYQRGSVSVRKRGGRNYWLAQWRDDGSSTTKELGPCSSMSQGEARALLAEIVRPINEAAGARAVDVYHTLTSFIKGVYLPVY